MRVLFAVMFLVAFTVKAQFSKVDGSMFKCNPNDLFYIIGQDNNAFYIFKHDLKEKHGVVQRYSKATLNQEWETILPFEYIGKDMSAFTMQDGKLNLFLVTENKKDDKVALIQVIVGTDGKVIENGKELYSVNDKNAEQNFYGCAFSPDSSKFLFYHLTSQSCSATTQAILLDLKTSKTVYNKAISNLYQGSSIINTANYTINNDGLIAFSFFYPLDVTKPIIFKEGNGYGASAQWANFWDHHSKALGFAIYDYNTEKTAVKTPNLPGDISLGSDMAFCFMNKKLFIGFIYNDAKAGKQNNSGVYSTLIDIAKGTVEYEGSQYFSEAWKKKYIKEGSGRADFHYDVTQVDGGIIASAFLFTQFAGNLKWFVDGMVLKFNTIGKLDWAKPLPMALKTGGRGVCCAYINKKMYYIYNDHKANEKDIDINNVEGSDETKTAGGTLGEKISSTCVAFDMSGKAKRTFIQSNENSAYYPLNKIINIGGNKILSLFKGVKQANFSTIALQ